MSTKVFFAIVYLFWLFSDLYFLCGTDAISFSFRKMLSYLISLVALRSRHPLQYTILLFIRIFLLATQVSSHVCL